MIGLRELVVFDPTRSNPAVRISYGQANFGKLLVIGESHYGGEEWARPDATHNRIKAVLNGKNAAYFTKIAHIFQAETREFYSRIAFYNFIAAPLDRARQRISIDDFKLDADQRFLFSMVENLLPDRILVTSERLWRVLPARHPDAAEGLWRVSDDSSDLFVPFTSPDESEEEKRKSKECFWYRRADGGQCLVGAITHPSAGKFNGARNEIAEWVRRFMTYKEGGPERGTV